MVSPTLVIAALAAVQCAQVALAINDAGPSSTSFADDVGQLKNHLAGIRDALTRPDLMATPVNISLGIRHVVLNEIQSTVTVSAWIRMGWMDSRNAWKGQFNGSFDHIKVVTIPIDHIWHPDIVLKNSLAGRGASLLDGGGHGGTATLYSDGRAVWAPTALLEAFCDLDLTRWPFERHVCQLHFGSWTLDNQQLVLQSTKHRFEFPGQTGEIVVDDVVETHDTRPEEGLPYPFDDIIYTIAMHREPGTYRAVVFTPAAVVIILCLSTFLMPPRAPEKVILGGVNAMLICLFLIYFAHSLPVVTDETPFVVLFYSISLYMVCVSLVAVVVVLNITRMPHASGLPWAVKRFLTGPCGRLLLLNGYIEQMMGVDHGPCSRSGPSGSSGPQDELPVVMHDAMEIADAGGPEIGSKSVSPDQDWLLLAAAIDRVLFVLYSLIFLILAVAFHV